VTDRPRAGRVVAVLGYSTGDAGRLHPICASRLARGEQLATGCQAVILSGWARRPMGSSEADLMRQAWKVPGTRLVCDRTAGSTAENAANVVAVAGALGAEELDVVTSQWHRPRTSILFRVALRGQDVRLSVDGARGPRPAAIAARELVCLALIPLQLLQLHRRRRSRPANVAIPDAMEP